MDIEHPRSSPIRLGFCMDGLRGAPDWSLDGQYSGRASERDLAHRRDESGRAFGLRNLGLLGKPELAAGWLVFKVGGEWGTWKTDPGVFNGFLTGTGLSLLWGASAGLLPRAILDNDAPRLVALLLGPPLMMALVEAQADSKRSSDGELPTSSGD
jgi:hypothetical protein